MRLGIFVSSADIPLETCNGSVVRAAYLPDFFEDHVSQQPPIGLGSRAPDAPFNRLQMDNTNRT